MRPRPLRERLWEDLMVQIEDRRNAWQMQSDGSYERVRPQPKELVVNGQVWLIDHHQHAKKGKR